ncbi:MAG: winged helix-turn-helix transcriptional regulator [Candidatus Sumerlaeia bacterium]|nr:winged helix-turn-helix transcriptional regulator [Candidatus Sumerlaeia bacterium]
MKETLAITRALSDPARIRTLLVVGENDLCVCQIIEMLGLAPSTVSKHLQILSQAGLVITRKEGRWVHVRLPRCDEASPAVCGALAWLRASLEGDQQAEADTRQLAQLLCIPREEISRRQIERMRSCCR